MKNKIVCLCLFFTCCISLFAQNEVKARIEFEEGEMAFNTNNFEEAVTRLSKAQDYLGAWSSTISYLKILSLDKLANYQKFENSNTQKLSKEVKLYMDYFNKNSDKIVEDKFKEVYRIDEKLNYAQKLSLYEKMPEYLQGIEAYEKKDYATAMKLWEQAAAKNNLLAMDKISNMYRDEIGVKKDYEKSIEWDTKAAAQGYIPSIADIGIMYYQGWGVSVDYQKAVEKLTIGAENGLDYAIFYLGRLYCDKKSTVRDTVKGEELLMKAVNFGFVRAMSVLASLNYNNNNYEKAMYWYKQAADKGYNVGMFWVGYLHENGIGTAVNHPEAMKWFQKAIDNGHISAMFFGGRHYHEAYGEKDIKKAIYYYTMGAEKGDLNSLETLAKIYRTGDGVKKDQKLAAEWQAKCDAVRAKK